MIEQSFNAKDFTIRLKATIQRTGKLGFTAETINQLQLNSDCSILIAPDSDDKKVYYLGILRAHREDAFTVLSAGKYIYLNTKQLFDKLKIDYVKNNFIFDMERLEEGDAIMGAECYKMKARFKPRTVEDKEL